jgi:dihydropteroate synthase
MHDKSTDFQQKYTLNARGAALDLSIPKIMGILNLTPDSFYDGGRYISVAAAVDKTAEMLSEGADIIDAGAYSSRPGADDISEEEELNRLLPVIEAITVRFPGVLLSVDTFRSNVAKAAVDAGASMVNDISGGAADPAMFGTVAQLQVPYVLMHMRGNPRTMTFQTGYADLFAEVCMYFTEKIRALTTLGVHDVIIDPGFGFAKTRRQSFYLLSRLDELAILFGLPVLAGVSRKSMIYKFLGVSADEALNGTTVLHTVALMKGAGILRVHDVKEAAEAVRLVNELAVATGNPDN